MSLSREQNKKGFREGALDKKSAIVAVEVAIGLLLIALVAKYGKSLTTDIREKVKALQAHKAELQSAIENDDANANVGTESAAHKAMFLNQLFLELADHAHVKWSHQAIQILTLLPELLRHHGPKEG